MFKRERWSCGRRRRKRRESKKEGRKEGRKADITAEAAAREQIAVPQPLRF